MISAPNIARQIEYNYAMRRGAQQPTGAPTRAIPCSTPSGTASGHGVRPGGGRSDARMRAVISCYIFRAATRGSPLGPVISYARGINSSEEQLTGRLFLADLITIHQKTGIGKSVPSAAQSSPVRRHLRHRLPALLLDYEIIAHAIVNTLATVSGIVSTERRSLLPSQDRRSPAGGILVMNMYARPPQYCDGEGLVKRAGQYDRNIGRRHQGHERNGSGNPSHHDRR